MNKWLTVFFIVLITGIFAFSYYQQQEAPVIEPASEPSAVKIFSPSDAKALGIKIDMSKSEVERILGAPSTKKTHFEGAFVGDVLTYFYQFGEVRLEPSIETGFTVAQIIIDQPYYRGPRNLKVGDSIKRILKRFPYNKNTVSDAEGNQYIYGKVGASYGVIRRNRAGEVFEILYSYGSGGFGTYWLSFKIADDLVKSINLGVMNI